MVAVGGGLGVMVGIGLVAVEIELVTVGLTGRSRLQPASNRKITNKNNDCFIRNLVFCDPAVDRAIFII